jgi:putative ATP-binding cassette transporter
MELLSTMQLQNKVDFVNSEFSTLNLSTGQRKRLAMVTALLEKRSILVFDEWAADQDPGFREFYYKELLPQLQKSGKTIIAVSHDDRYFNCADRVVKMEFGKIQDIF